VRAHNYITSCLIACVSSVHADDTQREVLAGDSQKKIAINSVLPELPGKTMPARQQNDIPTPTSSIQEKIQTLTSGTSKPRSISANEVKNITVPIALTQSTTAVLGANRIELQHQSENIYSNLSVGGVAQGDKGLRPATTLNMAYALTEQGVVGANLHFSPQRTEVVLNSAYQSAIGLRTKASLGYMWGRQAFDFPSGKEDVKLAQLSYALDLKYHDKNWFENLQSVGLAIWGSRARQHSADTPVYLLQQSAHNYQILVDSRKLALGRLQGQALDMQFALLPNVVMQTALGREQLVFPFSDGSSERNTKLFSDVKLHYEPSADWLLTSHYQSGTSGQKFGLSIAHSGWKLAVMHQRGSNGIKGIDSVMLGYDFSYGQKNSSRSALAERMQIQSQDNKNTLLRDAANRPSKMPQSFLAKVDPSATKNFISICKNASVSNITINPNGQLSLAVGSGAITIMEILRNGLSFAYEGIFSPGNASLNISLPNLPQAQASDLYLIEVADSNGNRYRIDADASLIKSLSCQ
jgi:hypothetical protein